MKWLKRIAILFGVLIVLVAIGIFWLLHSEAGARFALARAQGAMDGKLAIERSSGTLAGPLVLDGVRYRDAAAGLDVAIDHVEVAVALGELLGRQAHVAALAVRGVRVALTTVPPPSPPPPSAPIDLRAPLDVSIDGAHVEHIAITQDGAPIFDADKLDLAAAWTQSGVLVKQLSLRAPAGSVDLQGTLATAQGFAGKGRATFDWRAADKRFVGTLDADSDGRLAKLVVALAAPIAAHVDATLGQSRDTPWTLKLEVPRFDPKKLLPDSTLTALALSLTGSGDRAHGELRGDVLVNEHRMHLEPARYTLDTSVASARVLRIDALEMTSPDATGKLSAHGDVKLDAKPLAASATIAWEGVELPADLVGQPLSSHGQLDVDGSAERYQAHGTLTIGPHGKPADLALAVNGTADAVTLDTLTLKQPKGGLDARGTITLKPALGWNLTATAKQLDPGAFAAEWPGAIDFDLATRGTMTDNGPDATIELDKLGGTLRKRALAGNAALALKPGYIVDGTVALSSGRSRVDIKGRGGEQTDATIDLVVDALGDWLPDASGHAVVNGRVHGKWPDLAVETRAGGGDLAVGATRVTNVRANVALTSVKTPDGSVDVQADGVTAAGYAFTHVALTGRGNEGAHTLRLEATGDALSATVALAGAAQNGDWRGSLSTLDLALKDMPRFALADPAALTYANGDLTAGDICLVGGDTRLCVGGDARADGSAALRYKLEKLQLALIAKLASPDAPLKLDGLLEGNGDVRRDAQGALSGHATIASPTGSVAYPDGANQPLVAYRNLALDATFAPGGSHITLGAALDRDGELRADIALGAAQAGTQALSGTAHLAAANLGFVEVLSSEVANVKGRAQIDVAFSGTTATPKFALDGGVHELALEVPSAGLKLHDGDVTLQSSGDTIHIAGTLASGDGKITLDGSGGIAANAPLKATIKGKDFVAADLPSVNVVVSPDLVFERSAEAMNLSGSVDIPRANIDLTKLPGAGSNRASADVVVVDAERKTESAPLQVAADVKVALGENVKLIGYGLDGKVAGQLEVRERPGRVPTGNGVVEVSGTYKAYGQDLKIETGRLLFAGTALDDPGLDIRAVREIQADEVKAGLQVRGTAQVPQLTVFSEPAMEQSDALSYLITGKPLSSLKSGEGDMLGSAARALGTAGGDLLAKRIGSKIGVDEIGVADNAAVGGAAFTVGKYLSPKLYLSYGVGIFSPGEVVTLRYLFSKRWNFEAQEATTGSRAGINYRIEK